MTDFSELGLDPKVLKAVIETGYTTPTPIQAEAIPHALQARDVLGIAQTGTGKTASFVLPMITILGQGRARARMPRSLVLCPTRELAAQVAENFDTYAKYTKLTKALLIGGVSFKEQDQLITRGVDVLIATPGRLLDHFERGKLLLTGVQIMVVDEADRMLDMGFIPDIERIFKLLPFTRQTLFFSATMAPEITRITQEFLHNPVRVEVARQATASETISQFLCTHIPSRRDRADTEKREVLRQLISGEGDGLTNAIIFCNRKRDVDVVAKSLKKHGLDAAAIHGDLDQSVRTRILQSFRDDKLRILVASDVAARGLDIPAVSHVINYDVPSHSEDYIHRIGRTGRAGRLGRALTIAVPADAKNVAAIEDLIGKPIPTMDDPLAVAALEAPAEKPKQAEAEDRPARSRSRKRAAPKEADVTPDSQSAVIEQTETEAVEAPQPARPPLQQSETRTQRGRDGGRDGGRNERRSNQGRGERVIGMGEHVPHFLTLDFRMPVINANDDDESTPDEQGDAQAEAPAKPEKPKRKPRSRAKKSAVDEGAEAAAAAEGTPAVKAADPAAAAPDAPSEAPEPKEPAAEKPKRRARTRAKAPAAKPDSAPDADAPKADKTTDA